MDTQFVQPIGTYTAAANGPLGQTVWSERRRFMYVQFLDAVTYIVGHVCGPASATTYKVTNDVSNGSALGLRFAGAIPNAGINGVAVTAVPAQNDYGYVQLEGIHSAIKNDGTDYAVGDTCIMIATDGTTQPVAAATTTGTLLYVGWVPAVITATSGLVYLKSLLW